MLVILALTLSLTPLVAPVQNSTSPACEGQLVLVRLDEVKSVAWKTYEKAIAAEKTWFLINYAATDIVAARVLAFDESGNVINPSNRVTVYLFNPPKPAMLSMQHDAARSAYITLHDSSSQTLSMYNTCMKRH